MFSVFRADKARAAHKRRRGLIAVPVVALAAGTAGFFLMAPANAGTAPRSDAALRDRIHDVSSYADTQTAKPASATATPTATGGTAQPHIIGGSATTWSSAPWMVQLWYDNGDNTFDFCGGTLVAQNKVLTAAHCVSGKDWYNNGVVIGGTATLGGTDTSPGSWVRTQWVNPSYNSSTIDNDTAVLTLETPFTFATLPLATNTDTTLYTAGTQATVYGWGVTDSQPGSQNLADTLQHVQLPVNSDTTCQTELDAAVAPGAYVPGHMVCAGSGGTGDDTTGKSTCSGDSGGPLVVGGRIIGIVSWGVASSTQDCNVPGTYDVFTKVSSYGGVVQPRINDTDVSRDFKADLVGRTSTASYRFTSTGSGFSARVSAPFSLTAYNKVVQADMDRDGWQDYIVRRSSDGNVYYAHRTDTRTSYSFVQIGTNWSTRRAIVVPGDVTGDGIPDLLSETSNGNLYVYSGKGNGLVNAPVYVGTGYTKYNLVAGHGDLTGDGKSDLVLREASSGFLRVAAGTGKASAPFGTPVYVGSGWNGYNAIVTVGDVTGDGKADLLARTNSSGTLFLFRGAGKTGSSTFSSPTSAGTGWNAYSLLG